MPTTEALLTVKNLRKYYPVRRGLVKKTVGYVKAVDDVSFEIHRGVNFGLVGESGCGKTTVGRCILRALDGAEGAVELTRQGRTTDILSLGAKALKEARRDMQMIFQDPYSSLNPRMIIKDIVAEPLVCNNACPKDALEGRVASLLEKVGLRAEYMYKYPHAFSGGQRQRVGIARALALNPGLLVCDEPVSALDVSVQAQVLNLLRDLQDELDLSYLFISHDLGVVRHICNVTAVMYVGRLVETADTELLFSRPLHPYTEALLSSIPAPDPEALSRRELLQGEVADPANPPPGCAFHPRCPYARDICRQEVPALQPVAGRKVACHLADTLSLTGVGDG